MSPTDEWGATVKIPHARPAVAVDEGDLVRGRPPYPPPHSGSYPYSYQDQREPSVSPTQHHYRPPQSQQASIPPQGEHNRPQSFSPDSFLPHSSSGGGKMASERAFGVASLCLRLFIVILTFICLILILTAPGACFSRYLNGQQISREICPGDNSIFPMNSDRWNDALHFQGRGRNVYGQVALIVISCVFALVALAAGLLHLSRSHLYLTYPQLCISGFSVIVFLVMGGVETWYATGFDHMAFFIQAVGNGVFSGCAGLPGCQIEFVVKGWAVAAAFYFLCAVLFLIDCAVVFLRRDK